ncbi:MAG: response regulator, partial [Myxococcota bacterium]
MGEVESDRSRAGRRDRSDASGPTVLVVAADGSVLAVTRRMLERRGFRTVVASGAGDARARVGRPGAEIAGVVLDLSMPGIEAECVFNGLRNLRGDVPILLTGGFGEDPVAARLVRSARTDFLAKPFGLAALGAKAGELFGPVRPARP